MLIIVEQSCIVIPYFNGLYVFMTKGMKENGDFLTNSNLLKM